MHKQNPYLKSNRKKMTFSESCYFVILSKKHFLASNFFMQMFNNLLQVSKNLSEVWFCTIFFHDFIHAYSQPQGRGWQPLGNEIFMSTGTPCQFDHKLQVSKKSLRSLILYNFFMILYMYIAWDRGRQLPGEQVLMSTQKSCHFIHLLQVSKKCLWKYVSSGFCCWVITGSLMRLY